MKTPVRTLLVIGGLALMIASFAPIAHAQESTAAPPSTSVQATVRAGYLSCHVASGWGFIFGSSRKVQCAYAMQPNYTEYYSGTISKFGADIGYLQSAVMLWSVMAPTTNLGQGALAGDYAGATASAAVGVGGGANALIGGFKSSIALQPISVEAQNGLNIAAGVASLSLKFDQSKPAKYPAM